MYISFRPSPSEILTTTSAIERCAKDIQQWMQQNFLQLNGDKSEIIMFGSKTGLKKMPSDTVTLNICDSQIESSHHAKDLGLILDQHLHMDRHINSTCRTAFYHLRNIAHIRRYLTPCATKTLIQA